MRKFFFVFLTILCICVQSCQKHGIQYQKQMVFPLSGGRQIQAITGYDQDFHKRWPGIPPYHIAGITIVGDPEERFYQNDNMGRELEERLPESKFGIDGIEVVIKSNATMSVTVSPSDTTRAWRVYFNAWNQYIVEVKQQ